MLSSFVKNSAQQLLYLGAVLFFFFTHVSLISYF